MNALVNDLLHIRIMERGAGFVTGMEIENLTQTSGIGATTSEYVAIFIPCTKNKVIGFGNKEGLAIHFIKNGEMRRNAGGDGVSGTQIPNNGFLFSAPCQIACGA